jgi:hypothetical protein
MDRLNVRNILKRKKHKLQDNNYSCPICLAGVKETTFHLFFTYSFSSQCWNHLGIHWDFDLPFHMMVKSNQQFNSEFFMLGAWLIWKRRNNTVFNRDRATFQGWKRGFIEEVLLQANRFHSIKQASFSSLVNLYR